MSSDAPKARVCKGCGRTQAPRLGGITYFSVPEALAGFWHIRCFTRARTAKENPADRIKTYWDDLSREETDSLIAQRKRELAAIGALSFPIEATFLGEQVTVLGPVHLFPPYDDPAYGKPNPSSNAQLMTQGADGEKFITIASSVFVDGKPLLGRNPPMRDPLAPWEKHLLGTTSASDDPYRNIEHDIREAEDHLDVSYDIFDCREKDRGVKSVSEILKYDDYSAWGEWRPGELVGLSEIDLWHEFVSFRGGEWAKRAESWLKDGIPAVVLAEFSSNGRSIADGRGRVSLAVGKNLRKLHAVTLACTGGEEFRFRKQAEHEAFTAMKTSRGASEAPIPISDDQIAFMYREGMSIRNIAEAYGIGKDTVERSLRRTGTPRRRRGRGPASTYALTRAGISDDQIAFMYREGMSIRDIAGAYGLVTDSVKRSLQRTGTPRRTHHEAGRTPSVLAKIGNTGPKTERKIVDLYLSGPEQSMAAVAATLGVDQRTVKKTLARYDIVTRGRGEAGRKVTPEMEQRAIEMYQAGTSSLEISRAFGVGQATVRRILIRHNVPRRPVQLFQENPAGVSLLCMGREVAFVVGRKEISAPKRAGMLYDASGTHWPSCSLLIAPFEQGTEEVDAGHDYFGRKATVFEGHVKLPRRRLEEWNELGEVKEIFYDRAGTKHPGFFRHEFHKPRGIYKLVFLIKGKAAKQPAVLYKLGDCFRLELPKGCIVDDRGIVLP